MHRPGGRCRVGVRTASEWAWRALVIGAAVVVSALPDEPALRGRHPDPRRAPARRAARSRSTPRLTRDDAPRRWPPASRCSARWPMVFGMLSFVGTQLTSQIDRHRRPRSPTASTRSASWLNTTFGITDTQLEGYVGKAARRGRASGSLTDTAASAGLTATHIVAGLFLAMFSLYFFLYDGPLVWGWVCAPVPEDGSREGALLRAHRVDPAVGVQRGDAYRRRGGCRGHRHRCRHPRRAVRVGHRAAGVLRCVHPCRRRRRVGRGRRAARPGGPRAAPGADHARHHPGRAASRRTCSSRSSSAGS